MEAINTSLIRVSETCDAFPCVTDPLKDNEGNLMTTVLNRFLRQEAAAYRRMV